jgi:nicotinate phosphoribosyltransferase
MGQRQDDAAVFELFFRKSPFGGKYAIFAGHDEVYEFLENYKFTDEHITYLKTLIPQAEDAFWDWLRQLDCSSLRVEGAQDGELVFPEEPLLRLHGPLALLQLVESPLLNFTNFSTLVRTNASRLKLLAKGSGCVEFGLRRAQGPNGAMTASKYSFLGGFDGSSNVYAGFLAGTPVAGTCAHSFIMSYEKEEDIQHSRMLGDTDLFVESMKYREKLGWTNTNLGELYAFVAFAHSYPGGFSSLVDSYSTLDSGVKNFVIVSLVLKDLGYDARGIRLDSGDLAHLSRECKKTIRETGAQFGHDFSHITVVASNDINEKSLRQLNADKHEIDTFGIGTNLVTCQAQPALGMVYKVVEFHGTARMKFSEELGKVTLPGGKSVVRVFDGGKPAFDLICLATEAQELLGKEEVTYYTKKALECDPSTMKPEKMELKTQVLVEGGKRAAKERISVQARREACQANLTQFGGLEGLIESPEKYNVYFSEGSYSLFCQKYRELLV